ncbi:Peptidase family M48 [Modestobacter sp. DSM 44400]|uniref:M56 family metallopeptidase n=1 Tax=Modestobacter sp. DSM 44400 TaxID=1550230 RepID=UPI000896D9EB|nr:M56 family metallopeptidase [Modestobacter sp. DSM 44400]SDY83097.1 Peptidase family M48 [Modestobacter sp. DSM 44400]
MTTAALLIFAALVAALAPRMTGAAWTNRAPVLGVVAWQAASAGVVLAVALAGLTLLVPTTAFSGSLADILNACAMTIASAYNSPGRLPETVLGSLLAGVVPLRLCSVAATTWARDRVSRRKVQASLLLGARPEPSLGAMLVESDRAAAFCLAGRQRTVVLTTGALAALSAEELAGVLAHEQAHLRAHHHLAVSASRILSRAFPFLPMFIGARLETDRLVELLADDAAAQRVNRVEIASALLTLAGMKAPSGALAAAQSAAAERITRLLKPAQSVRPIHRILGAALAFSVVGAPLALAAAPLLSAISSGLCSLPPTGGGWS